MRLAQIQRPAQPDHKVIARKFRIHAVQGCISWDNTRCKYLDQAVYLEDSRPSLGMAGKGLLRNNIQRIAFGPADSMRQRVMKFRLVRVISIR